VVTITVTCYSWTPSSGDHLFSCGAISRPPHTLNAFLSETDKLFANVQGRNEGGEGGTILRAPNHYGAAEWLRWAPKSPDNVTSTFFNGVHLLTKDLRFEYGGAKLASCFGSYLTSLRPCSEPSPENRHIYCLPPWKNVLDMVWNYWTQFKKFGPLSGNSSPLLALRSCWGGLTFEFDKNSTIL